MEITNLTINRIKEFLAKGKRFDFRNLLESRDIIIETGVSKNAEGSARVKLGNTEVVAGVKIETSEPYTDHEEEGTLVSSVELLPLSSPRFEYGPPKIESIEIARIVDRGIRECGFIDFSKLVIKKGEKVYSILLDMYSINNEGNLIDAFALAAVTALLHTKMPVYDEKEEKIKYGEFTDKGLPLTNKIPITMTFHKIGGNIIIDPILEEEDASEGRISLALTKSGKDIMVNAAQKGDYATFSEKEMSHIIDSAIEKFKELENKILKNKK